jgi:iron complex outermembrane receptor protein
VKDQSLQRVIARVLALSMAGLGSGAVWAQEEPAPPVPQEEAAAAVSQEEAAAPATPEEAPPAEAATGGLEEVIVQAQRRTESLQEVPLSIAAFTGDELVKVAPVTLEDLNGLIPNVKLEHVGLFRGAAAFSMRGIGTSGIESFNDPAVAVFINGVYQARNAVALSSTLDIEAVEVMRGPQGTIYGRNAYAGAISLRTKRPEMNEFSGYGRLNLANFNQIDADIVTNLPIIEDKLAARIAARSHQMDGYYRNNGIVDAAGTVDQNLKGDRIMGEKNTYIRPSLLWTPTDDIDVTLFGEIFKDRSEAGVAINQTYDPEAVNNANCGSVGPAGGPVPPGTGINCPISTWEVLGYPGKDPWGDDSDNISGDGTDPWVVGQSLRGRPQDVDSYNLTLESNFRTDHGMYTLTLNYGDVTEEIWSDTDGENVNLFSSARWQDYETYSLEGHFVSDFSDTIDLVAGLFYFYDKYQTGQITFTVGNPVGNPIFDTNMANLSYGTNGAKRTSWAAYAQGEWHFTDTWSAVLGARYSYEKKYDAFGQPILAITTTGVPRGSDYSKYPVGPAGPYFEGLDDNWDNFAPRVGVNYKPNDDLFVFAFWQRAFKSGGFNMNANVAEVFFTPYGPEQVDNYEVGFKSEWLENRLRFNGNVFYAEYTGVQRNILRPAATGSGVITFTDNAADIESYGAEFELAYLPIDDLQLYANLGLTHAEYSDFCAELDGAETTTTPQSGLSVCGETTTIATTSPFRYLVETDWSNLKPVRAPEIDATLGVTKDFVFGDSGRLVVDANWNYTSELETDLLNRPRSDRAPLDVLNASMTWRPDSDRYSITLWGKNITDNVERLNVAMVANLFAFANGTQPRTYGVTIQSNF